MVPGPGLGPGAGDGSGDQSSGDGLWPPKPDPADDRDPTSVPDAWPTSGAEPTPHASRPSFEPPPSAQQWGQGAWTAPPDGAPAREQSAWGTPDGSSIAPPPEQGSPWSWSGGAAPTSAPPPTDSGRPDFEQFDEEAPAWAPPPVGDAGWAATQEPPTPGAWPPPIWPPPSPPAPGQPAPVPSFPARPYHQFWRSVAWWRPVLATVCVVVCFFIVSTVVVLIAMVIEMDAGDPDGVLRDYGKGTVTVGLFLANNLSLAFLALVCPLLSWGLVRMRPGWLSSVVGRLRWGWMVRCALIVLPLWVALYLIEQSFLADWPALSVTGRTALLLIGILITTPFQAAGEEYFFRGLLNRTLARFLANERAALALGAVVSSGLFTLAHFAADPWLNAYYFAMGLGMCHLTWRTGGLEAAIALHVVNNLVAEALMPFSDISGVFSRGVGAGDPSMLVNIAAIFAVVALLEWVARRRGVTRVGSAPIAPVAARLPG